MNTENLGPAETIINSILPYSDHMFHNRPGLVTTDPRAPIGVKWEYSVVHRRCIAHPDDRTTSKESGRVKTCTVCSKDVVKDGGFDVLYRLSKVGKKSVETKIGIVQEDGTVVDGAGTAVGRYQPVGIFPEVAVWIYRQIAAVWKLDNEFAAHWASFAFDEEHRDRKVALAAFMLVQSRKGDPVVEDGKVAFHDEDFRDVGEAMMLLRKKNRDLDAKRLLRIHEILCLPEVAAINRELGFGKSARHAFTGRWEKVVEKWLRHREENPLALESLVKAGFTSTIMELARKVGYKPSSPKFFEALHWKQKQSSDGRRSLALDAKWAARETWQGLDEEAVCRKIVETRPSWKVIVATVPSSVGVTRAVAAAAIEAGCVTDKDLVIISETLESLGLLEVQEVKERWLKALKASEDMRAANIATRVKTKEVRDKLQEAAEDASKKAVEEVARGIRVYFMVDKSSSMQGALEKAKEYVSKFVVALPADRVHVSVFDAVAREVKVKHPTAAGVEVAFRGIAAGGGTAYEMGHVPLMQYKPEPGEDVLFVYVGDEKNHDLINVPFDAAVRASELNPTAFGLVHVGGPGIAVQSTAASLGIPCFQLDERVFEDPYGVPRAVRNLIASTPVGKHVTSEPMKRETLVDKILKTKLLAPPPWASASV